MSTDDVLEIEDRLRAALSARAELVRPEDLGPVAPVVPLRPRWQSPWVLLATAAVVLLVLGVVYHGVGGGQRSDRLAPDPDPQVEVPPDIGRDWKPEELDTHERLDLDGDGTKEKVVFLAEETPDFDGRFRMQTTLSTTGEEAYGIAELGTTIGISSLDPIDADGDGDLELVFYVSDLETVNGSHPLVFDLRDGYIVEASVEDPELLRRGEYAEPGTTTDRYEMVRAYDYWVEDGTLWSSRSRGAFASANMTTIRPPTYVVDAWSWTLDDAGVLRPAESCGTVDIYGERGPCEDGEVDALPQVSDVATETFGAGEQADFGDETFGFTASLVGGDDPSLVIEGMGATRSYPLDVPDPRVSTVQPRAIFSDGAAVVVTSASDPGYVQVLTHDGERLRALEPVGEVEPTNDGTRHTWLTADGTLVTAVAEADGTWRVWFWLLESRSEMTALPGSVVCFDDVDDPSSLRRC